MSLLDQFNSPKSKRSSESGVVKKSLHQITKTRYLNYAMSVITSRALPDVRDGLKPVQRRILYAMYHDLKLYSDRKHRKSAAVVGGVMAKYHPHGDMALYGAMVRMSQDWVMRTPLVDGHGNFGNIDGDNAAAHRYTESRLKKAGELLMSEIDKDTVPFRPNFDGTTEEPLVLPVPLPLLLVNGSSGIAVGMATNIPPHNPVEVIDAAIDLLKFPQRKVSTLVKNHIQGPDFPTGGSIVEGQEKLTKIYEQGKGSVTIRPTWKVEKRGRKRYLVFTEIPYGVAKQNLVEKIAAHIIDGSLPQVTDIRDESTSDVRVVLELKSKADVDNVLAYLYKHTPLEMRFHVNLTCLVPEGSDNAPVPKTLDLKQILEHFLTFRMEVVRRRLENELGKLQKRIHLLEGYVKVLSSPQEAVAIVTKAKSKGEARDQLMKAFSVDETQAENVLNTRVYRFASYEIDTFRDELSEKQSRSNEIEEILSDEDQRKKLIIKELREARKLYASDRKTLVSEDLPTFEYDEAAFIEAKRVRVIVSRSGWVRRQNNYSSLDALRVRDGDEIGWALEANTTDVVLFFTNHGRVYTSLVDDLPDTSGYGDPIQSMFSFGDGENIIDCYVVHSKMTPKDAEMVAVSNAGRGVRFDITKFIEPSTVRGRSFMRLGKNQQVLAVDRLEDPKEDYAVLITRDSRVLSFLATEVSKVRGSAKGVQCIDLQGQDSVLAFGLTSGSQGDSLTVLTSNGAEKSLRHTTNGPTSRAGKGTQVLKRDGFVSWKRPVREVTF